MTRIVLSSFLTVTVAHAQSEHGAVPFGGASALSAGAGGAYENYSIGNASGFLFPRSG